MKKKVLYWDGIYGDELLLDTHKTTILKLVNGDYESAHLDLKKCANHRVYSVWTEDKAGRLLFTTVETQEQGRCLLLLGVVENHDYHKSPFLKPAVLSAFLDKKASTLIDDAVVFEDFDQVLFEKPAEPAKGFVASPMSYYKQQFISFNITQLEAINAPLPLLVTGCAGSGKSCVLDSLKKLQGKILYITQSKKLVLEMQKQSETNPRTPQLNNIELVFKTYTTLLLELHESLKEYDIVAENYCLNWFKDHLKRFPCNIKLNETLYQEFRIISAFDEKNYLQLGKKQSLFNEPDQKNWLFKAYEKYQKTLTQQKKLDPSLFKIDSHLKGLFDFILVDEALDFSHGQLLQLGQLAINNQIAYCADSHQNLNDIQSKLPYLRELTKPNKPIELPGSYRNPPIIIQNSNFIFTLKYFLTGGLSDKEERPIIHSLSNKEGKMQWVDYTPGVTLLPQGHSNLVVITLPQYKEEAKKLFNTPLVFTVAEIKGLEFESVVIFQLLNQKKFETASKLLSSFSAEDIQCNKTIYRSKDDEDQSFALYFNEFHTAFTRTEYEVICIQQKTHALDHLISLFKSGMPGLNPEKPSSARINENARSWESLLTTLIENEQFEQAKGVYVEKLQRSEESFLAFCDTLRPSQLSVQKEEVSAISSKTYSKGKKTSNTAPKIHEPTNNAKPECKPKQTINNTKNNGVVKIISPLTLPKGIVRMAQPEEIKYLLLVVQPNLKGFYKAKMEQLTKHKEFELFMFGLGIEPHGFSFFNMIYGSTSLWPKFVSFFQENRKLLKVFSAKILCEVRHGKIDDMIIENGSILYFLSSWNRIEFLELLLNNNKKLYQEISPETLCRKGKIQDGKTSEIAGSVVDYLSCTPKGSLILKKLLIENKSFAKEITMDLFRQADSNLAKIHDGNQSRNIPVGWYNTALFNLTSCSEGLEILDLLFNQNPSLLKDITVEDLCRPSPCKENTNKSPLFHLASTEKGRKLLYLIFSENQELPLAIPKESWNLAVLLPNETKWTPLKLISNDPQLLSFLPEKIVAKSFKSVNFFNSLEYSSSQESDADEFTSPESLTKDSYYF